MAELIAELIKENWTEILTHGFMFLVGIGMGAGITDTLNNMKGEDDDKER